MEKRTKFSAPERIDSPHVHAGVALQKITPVSELIRSLPSTRYYGSKRKLLPWIYDNIKTLRFDTVLDAFGGTGSVSQLLRAMRKDVTYHDAFSFNTHVAAATLVETLALDERQVTEFLERCAPSEGVVSRVFENLFFLPSENKWIDGYMSQLEQAGLNGAEHSLLMHLLFQACLKKRPFNLFHRANLGLRTRKDVSRSFGNASTWERSFSDHILSCFHELQNLSKLGFRGATIAAAGDAMELPTGYDLVYLDPPYVSTSSSINADGYWRRYHFLEGLARYSTWEAEADLNSPIREIPTPSFFRDWSHARTSKEKLFDLVSKHSASIVVLSYLQDAYPNDEEIRRHFEKCFPLVSVHLTTHSHALSASNKREMLFIGRQK